MKSFRYIISNMAGSIITDINLEKENTTENLVSLDTAYQNTFEHTSLFKKQKNELIDSVLVMKECEKYREEHPDMQMAISHVTTFSAKGGNHNTIMEIVTFY